MKVEVLKHKLIFLLLLFLTLGSCVGNKYIDLVKPSQALEDEANFEYQNNGRFYCLKEGDVIGLSIKKVVIGDGYFALSSIESSESSSGSSQVGYLIDSTGYVDFPFLGRELVAGKSFAELNKHLSARASSQFPGCTVQTFLINSSIKVLGEVRQPGAYLFDPNSRDLLSVLSQAGGLLDYADRKSVNVIRQTGSTTKVLKLDLTEQSVLTNPDFYVENRDIIYVRAMERRRWTTVRDFQWAIAGISALAAFSSLILTLTR